MASYQRKRDPSKLSTGGYYALKKKGTECRRQMVFQIDDETFQEIRAIAASREVSLSSVLRELIEFGLEDMKELTKS